ncbi:MAG: 16S rRNA (adenine(1518)-N(6)/adenine(1519)-N(6))-dimethyltransferase RsmA [bacterium]
MKTEKPATFDYVRPVKMLGQNFLIDKAIINKLINEATIQKGDAILEIGPGTGNLTQALAEKARLVVAIEKDQTLCPLLEEDFKKRGINNVRVICGDALKTDIGALFPNNSYKIVANLPFYISAPIIRKFLESENQPSLMVLLVQKEVGQRICAKPPKMNLLAISVQFYSQTTLLGFVSKKSFRPKPNVDGAITKIVPLSKGAREQVDISLFFKIVKNGFAHPRKQLINNLSFWPENKETLKQAREKCAAWLLENKISPTRRPETLTLNEWISLVEKFPFKSL